MTLDAPTRPDGCLSELAFDRLFAGELGGEALLSAQEHVGRCERCGSQWREIAEEREAFLALRPLPDIPGRVPRRDGRSFGRRWVAGAATLLATAAAVVLLLQSRGQAPATGGEVRTKGAEHIDFLVERGETAERGSSRTALRPGDRVRFVYSSPRPAHLAVLALDTSGAASVYFPAGEHARRIEPGAARLSETAVELDGVLGRERLFAVFCDAPFAPVELRDRLERDGALEAPDGCRVHLLEWSKGPAAR